ncbi:MAG: class D beta-lactamase [Syntrophotaleaceae bacterium]
MNIRLPAFLLLLPFVLATASDGFCEDAALSRLFDENNVTGTIVITNFEGTETFIHNQERADTPFIPASTFKIPNTLIALDKGVITEQDTLKWDGKDTGVADWNRDQTLESAFRASCVWFFQELAQRIGTDTYRVYLGKIGYGNAEPAPEVTTFWLEGDLRISAMEQIAFLKKVYRRELPFGSESFDTLSRIMLMEKAPSYTLWAKTGWGQRVTPQIGWYVGYVERNDGVWFFAMNMVITKPKDARFRQEITMEALRLKGIVN